MKLLKRVVVLSLCALLLSGCTQSSFERNSAPVAGPGSSKEEDVTLADPNDRGPLIEENPEPETLFAWEQVDEDFQDMFDDPSFYPLGASIAYEINEEETAFTLQWVLKNEATEDDAMEYATEMVQKFNDILAVQKAEYDLAGYQEFGDVWNDFGLTIQISKEDGTMMIDKTYAAGSEIDLKLPELQEGGPTLDTTRETVSPGSKKN